MLGTIASAARADFNPAIDFSPTVNPSGVWRYGWTQTLGGNFVLDTNHVHDAASGLDLWYGSVISSLGNFPIVTHNGTSSTVTPGTVSYAPGQLGLHPGPNGEYSVVRFTAPSSGQFAISGSFGGLDYVGPTTTDVRILLNNVQIFSGSVSSFGNGPSFSFLRSLSAGDALDFAVGFGSNATYFYDSTSLSANISPVPEAPALTMFGIGCVLILATKGARRPLTAA